MSARKILYNTILQSVGKLVSLVVGFVTVVFLTRYLKEAGYGEYTTVITYMGFFGILADLGLYLYTAQEISRPGADEKKILGNVFSLRLVTVVTALLAGAAIALILPYSTQVKTAMFVAIINFTFVSATQVLVGVFQKHLIFYKLIASEIIARGATLATTLLFIFWGLGLTYFIISVTLASLIHFIISLVMARSVIAFRLSWDRQMWQQVLSKSWPLGLSVVSNLLYFKGDTIILSLIKPSHDVGVYGAAYKFFEILLNFPAMFAGLIMPFLARYASLGEWGKYKLYLQRSYDALLLFVIPMVISVLFFARPVIDLVAGKGRFAGADKVLMILIFAAGITYLGQLLGYTVVALNLQKKMIWGYLLGTVLGLVLYLLLIPRFTYFGAAAATVVVELVVFAYAYFLTSHHSGYFPNFAILAKGLAAAVPMAALYYYFDFQWPFAGMPEFVLEVFNWTSQVVVGLGVYFIGLYFLKAVPRDFVRGLLNKSPQGPTPPLV